MSEALWQVTVNSVLTRDVEIRKVRAMPHTQMELNEVARYLHISPSVVEQLVKDAAIPFMRQGQRPVFVRKDVDGWATRRLLGLSGRDLHAYHRETSARFHDLSNTHALIHELIMPERINPAMASRTMPSTIRAMTDMAIATDLVVFPEELIESVVAREKLCTTAMPGGFALMHPLHHEPYIFEDSFMVIGRAIQAIPFHAPDGRTTRLFFLICCQDERIHLHVLARICMMCRETALIFELDEADNADEMFAALVRAEKEIIARHTEPCAAGHEGHA